MFISDKDDGKSSIHFGGPMIGEAMLGNTGSTFRTQDRSSWLLKSKWNLMHGDTKEVVVTGVERKLLVDP